MLLKITLRFTSKNSSKNFDFCYTLLRHVTCLLLKVSYFPQILSLHSEVETNAHKCVSEILNPHPQTSLNY